MFVQRQFQKIMQNKASIQDLTFAKEFRGLGGYRPGAVVPAFELTKYVFNSTFEKIKTKYLYSRRFMRVDRRSIPRSGERVPYIIVYGEPGRPLIQSVRSPQDLVQDSNLRPNSHYYITKVLVPPLNRCFSLVGADIGSWYTELPKCYRPRLIAPMSGEQSSPSKNRPGQGIILNYFASHQCASCGSLSKKPICEKCVQHPQTCIHSLTMKIHHWDRAFNSVRSICNSCMKFSNFQNSSSLCSSLDCPVFYKALTARFDAEQINYVLQLIDDLKF